MPSAYAIEGAGVFVPARIAAGLERALNLDAYRMSVRGHDRQLDEVMLAWHSSAVQWVDECREQGKFRALGTSFDRPGNFVDHWSSTEVAARTGCDRRAITKAATEGRLVGELVDGRWRFQPDDVAHWRATRRRGSA